MSRLLASTGLVCLLCISACFSCQRASADAKPAHPATDNPAAVFPDSQLFGKVTAPDFPANAQWLNSDHAVSLKELRGKVVLLDFWTYCCINCMHVIPELKKLEHKYAD